MIKRGYNRFPKIVLTVYWVIAMELDLNDN